MGKAQRYRIVVKVKSDGEVIVTIEPPPFVAPLRGVD
jgi:hypothetical protein